jgi:hypothetical protein
MPRIFAADEICYICGLRIENTVYSFKRAGDEKKVMVCGSCARLETTCYICLLPVKSNFLRLADGRLLCADDTKIAILEQGEAEKIFDDVKSDLQSMLAGHGTLPHHNIRVHLDAKARLDKSGNVISAHEDRLLMGLTRTKSEEGKMEHDIHLLYGLTRPRLLVVAAHEYGHTWLHENVTRKLNADTVEGVCDWLAYKLIADKEPHETKVLLESKYSRGQLQALIAAEKEHGFYHLMQWIKHGVDPELDVESLERTIVLRGQRSSEPPPSTPFGFAPPPPRLAPTNLVLKGLSGPKTRRFALINDGTFQLNEQGKVRLGMSNVVIRCLQILDDSVTIQVTGESETRTLKLNSTR